MKTTHHIVENISSSLKITITNPRPSIRIFLYGVMLIFGVIFIPLTLFKFGLMPVAIIPVSFWALWEVWGFFYFLKLIFGKEIVEISQDFIIVSNDLFGFVQKKTYPSKFIRDFRILANPFSHEYRTWPRSDIWWDKGDGSIAFQFNTQSIQIGKWLDESEAQEIMDIIQSAFPQYHA